MTSRGDMDDKTLHQTFAKRAATWEKDEGELGKIVAAEIRTVNDAWMEATGDKSLVCESCGKTGPWRKLGQFDAICPSCGGLAPSV